MIPAVIAILSLGCIWSIAEWRRAYESMNESLGRAVSDNARLRSELADAYAARAKCEEQISDLVGALDEVVGDTGLVILRAGAAWSKVAVAYRRLVLGEMS